MKVMNKYFSLFLFLLILGFGSSARAVTEISTCTTLASSSETYILTQDIGSGGDCITIEAPQIILDGNNHSLNGLVVASSSLPLYESITIKNVKDVGVYFGGGTVNFISSTGTVTVDGGTLNATSSSIFGLYARGFMAPHSGNVNLVQSNVDSLFWEGLGGSMKLVDSSIHYVQKEPENSHTISLNIIDNTPQITLNGDSTVHLRKGSVYSEAGASASAIDIKDGILAVSVNGSVDVNTPGIYYITYSATDGGTSVPVYNGTVSPNIASTTRTIIVEEDAPTIHSSSHSGGGGGGGRSKVINATATTTLLITIEDKSILRQELTKQLIGMLQELIKQLVVQLATIQKTI